MRLIIDIPEYLYDAIMVDRFGIFSNAPCNVIRNGTPLPKGHGKLIDRDWLYDNCELHFSDKDGSSCCKWRDINNAPTIIEADKEAENGEQGSN